MKRVAIVVAVASQQLQAWFTCCACVPCKNENNNSFSLQPRLRLRLVAPFSEKQLREKESAKRRAAG